MNGAVAQHHHPSPQVSPDVVIVDNPMAAQQAPQHTQTAAGVPPPSPLEPPASQYQQRAQSHPTTNMAGPTLPAMSHPAPQHSPQGVTHPLPQNPNNAGFASPEGSRDLLKADQYNTLATSIKTYDPAIVRQVLRDHWGQCFVGSEYHTAFALNTALHQASPATLNRAVLDFGSKLVSTCKGQIMEHFRPDDFDQMAEFILNRASTRFLDRALALRVETIGARDLVNILGRAERLGYDVEDIVEEHASNDGTGMVEQVIPSLRGVPPLDQQPSQGLIQCGACLRPCSGEEALAYHSKKAACDPDFDFSNIGKSTCPHCGCSFGSSGGASYHIRSEVCGTYSEDTTQAIHQALQHFVPRKPQPTSQNGWTKQPQAAATPMGTTKPVQSNHTPANPHASRHFPSSAIQIPRTDPYKDLNPDARERFRQDIARAEEIYGQKMREAMLLPEPESTDRLSRHKNAYNAKISTTRKRYGIRLRERRSKEGVDAERIRLLGRSDAPEVWLEQERKARELEKSGKRPFDIANRPGGTAPMMGAPSQTPQPQANGLPPVDSPRKRVPLSEMGGLSGSAGSAEVVDPTAHQALSSQPRGFVQMQQQQPPPPQVNRPTQGTRGDPMAVDSNSETVRSQEEDSGSDADTTGDDSDEDIPAV